MNKKCHIVATIHSRCSFWWKVRRDENIVTGKKETVGGLARDICGREAGLKKNKK